MNVPPTPPPPFPLRPCVCRGGPLQQPGAKRVPVELTLDNIDRLPANGLSTEQFNALRDEYKAIHPSVGPAYCYADMRIFAVCTKQGYPRCAAMQGQPGSEAGQLTTAERFGLFVVARVKQVQLPPAVAATM